MTRVGLRCLGFLLEAASRAGESGHGPASTAECATGEAWRLKQMRHCLPRRVGDSRRLVLFHFATLDADMFFELALGYIKGVAQSDIHVFVGLLVMVFAADDDLLAGNVQVNADMEEIPLVLVLMVEFNRDPATDDVVAELLQFCRFIADPRFYCVGMGKATKRNLYGVLHVVSRFISNGLLSGKALS
jgi:hypothetical protein